MVYWKFPAEAAIKAVSSSSTRVLVREVAWQPGRGELLALSTSSGGRILNMGQEKTEPVEFGTNMTNMTFLAWSPAGDLLATVGEQNVIWKLNGTRMATLQAQPGRFFFPPQFNESGRLVGLTRQDPLHSWRGCFDVFDTLTGALRQSFGYRLFRTDPIVWKNELDFFGFGYGEAAIYLWRVGQEEPVQIMNGHFVSTMAFNPKRDILASGGRDGTVRLWTSVMSVLTGHSSEVIKMIWVSHESGVLASWDRTGHLRVWDALSKTILHVYGGFLQSFPHLLDALNKQVKSPISFSPDGRFLAVGGRHENVTLCVRVVRVNTGETVAVCQEIGKEVFWSPEGNKLAVKTVRDGDVSVYNLEKIMRINLKDLSMMKVAALLKVNLGNGKDEAKDALTKEGVPESLITDICSHLM